MAKNLPAKTKTPWHPCDDGLIPIAEALERCSAASVSDLPERIRYQSTCPSHKLCEEINGSILDRHGAPPRVEMVRRWLQTNGLVEDAKELKSRWVRIFRRFQRWEEAARYDIAPFGSYTLFRSDSTHEGYCHVIELIDDMADWCRQLAWMLRAKLEAAGRRQADREAPADPGITAKDVIDETTSVVFLGDGIYQKGSENIKLDGNEANVVQALLELGAATKDELTKQSGVSDASRVLRGVHRKHAMLRDSITLPGRKGRGGYRTTIVRKDAGMGGRSQ